MTIQIHLPDDLRDRLKNRAAENGFESVELYAEALLRADADADFLPEDVEDELARRLANPAPGIEVTEEFKAAFLERLRERHNGRQAR